MTDKFDELSIACARRRAFELGAGCLALAKLEAEELTQRLGRTVTFAEMVLIEHVAYASVRARNSRNRGLHREADKETRLLATLLKHFEKQSMLTIGRWKDRSVDTRELP
jgi:hypothetical protein